MLFWLVLLLLGAVALLVGGAVALTRRSSSASNKRRGRASSASSPSSSPTYFLAALVIAKNESLVIEEFLRHHEAQGVEHVFLINNGSTDDMVARVQPWIQRGVVTLYQRPAPRQQVAHYNAVYAEIRTTTEWLAIIDVDEYLFGLQQPLHAFLRTHAADTDVFHVTFSEFGSSGHDAQPASVRAGFIHRTAAPICDDRDGAGKCVFRTALVPQVAIHMHSYTGPTRRVRYLPAHETQTLRLHHYRIMSREYWRTVKMTRGDAVSSSQRGWADFDAVDQQATIEDTTLRDLRYV